MKTKVIFIAAALICTGIAEAQKWTDPLYAREDGYSQEPSPQPFYLPNKLVKPTLPEADKKHDIRKVDAATGGVITTSSGTKISIPAKAFVDRNGKPITGDVQIDYRQFSNPIDFIASGIPMTYDNNGKTETFESAGMFELAASKDGEQVFLKKGKSMQVDMVTTDASDSYDFYALDENKGWVEKGKAAQAVAMERTDSATAQSYAGPSKACVKFFKILAKSGPRQPEDTTLLDARFDSASYFFTKKTKSSKDAFIYAGHYGYDVKLKTLISLARVRTPVKGEIAFEIRYKSKYHPELSGFAGKKWVVDDAETPASFRQKYGYRARFNDIRISDNGGSYTLNLKGRNGTVELHAIPVTQSELNSKDRIVKAKTRDYKNYAKSLGRKRKSYDGEIQKQLAKYYDWKEHRLERAWQKSRSKMDEKELAMNLDEWKTYVAKQPMKNAEVASLVGAEYAEVTRSLRVSGFGIFNCDHFTQARPPVYVRANFKKADGENFVPLVVYSIDKQINGFCSFYTQNNVVQVQLDPRSRNVLIAMDKDGKLAVAKEEEVKKNLSSKILTATFTVTPVSSDPLELNALIN